MKPAGAPVRAAFLFPAFPLDNPVTGGEKYNAVMLHAALADSRLAARFIPVPQRLPARLAGSALVRRLWYQFACLSAVLRTPADVLISDASYHSWVLSALWVSRLLRPRVPIVMMAFHVRHVVSRRSGLSHAIERWSERQLYRATARAVAISEATREHLQREGLEPERIAMIPPATDVIPHTWEEIMAWRAVRRADPIRRLLLVGQVNERKGVHVLLEALGQLGDLPWRLDVVGRYEADGAYLQGLQQILRTHQIEDRVCFRGFVDEEDLADAYRAADVFCLPSLQEGYGIVLIDAMGYGLPVVASRAGSIPELVQDGETGLLVPVGDAMALALALRTLLSDEALRKVMTHAAHRRAAALYRTWEQVAAELMELIVDQSRRGG